jgi:cobalt/nickel transport system permease protein
MLNGLLGLILGVAALPALAVALFLQTVLLGFGGVSALGANILGMGIPALATGWLFSARCRTASTQGKAMLWGGAAGMFSVLLTCVLFALVLYMSKPMAYVTTVKALVAVHLPIAAIEAVVAGASVGFFYKVRPDMLLSPVCNRASGRRDESG